MSEIQHIKRFSDRLSKLKDVKVPFGKFKGNNLINYNSSMEVWMPSEVFDDNDYWIWFFTNVEDKSSDIINIKRYMCLSAYILCSYYNVEGGFLRKYGNAFVKDYGMDYKDDEEI